MASTKEVKVKTLIDRRLTAYNALWTNNIGSGYAKAGVSDKTACRSGVYFAIEAKAGKGMPTALQIKHLMAVEAAGGVALVINEHNLDYLEACLRDPHNARSNYRAFITPAVRAALEVGHETEQLTLRKREAQ